MSKMSPPNTLIVIVAIRRTAANDTVGRDTVGTTPIRAVRRRVEYTEGTVFGLDTASPRFSFEAAGGADRGETIAKYEITVSRAANGKAVPVWDSGPTVASSSQQITPPASVTFAPDSR